jgi:hypothetical protein
MKALYGINVTDFEPGWWPNGNKCYRVNENDSPPFCDGEDFLVRVVSWWDYERSQAFEFVARWPRGWRYGRFVSDGG